MSFKGFKHTKPRHFVRVILPDFLKNMKIPESFQEHLNDYESGAEVEGNDDKNATLRDNQGKFWSVKLDNVTFHFKDGWNEFCQEHELQVGDVMVFKLVDDFVFDVFIFDPSGCERGCVVSNNDVPVEDDEIDTRNVSKEPRIRTCSLVLKPCNYSCSQLNIPLRYAYQDGLDKFKEVELIDENGRKWLMPFTIGKYKANIRNWRDIHRANGFQTGDTVILELLEIKKNRPVIKVNHWPLNTQN